MTKQTIYHLSEVHRLRIKSLAQGHEDSVALVTKHGSGKTLILQVVLPGIRPVVRTVVQLHRKFHKAFYAIVKAAECWLAGFKAYVVPKLLLLPAPMVARSDAEMLKTAASKVPAKSVPQTKGGHDLRWGGVMFRDRIDMSSAFEAVNPGGAK